MEQEEVMFPKEQGTAGQDENLILGLPDEMGVLILARVPRCYHHNLKGVCRRWWNLLCGTSFSKMQHELSRAEEWLYLWIGVERGWCCFDLYLKKWFSIPAMPHDNRVGHFGFGSFDAKLFVVGGSWLSSKAMVPSKMVSYFDAQTYSWRRAADLNIPRSKCMVATISDRLYVLGGTKKGFEPTILGFAGGYVEGFETNAVEVYDHVMDLWKFVSSINFPMLMYDSAVLGEKLYGVGYQEVKPKRVVYDEHAGRWRITPHRIKYRGVVYDAQADRWEDMSDTILDGWKGTTAVLNGKLYSTVHEYGHLELQDGYLVGTHNHPNWDLVIRVYNPSQGVWEILHRIWSGLDTIIMEETEIVSFGGRLCVGSIKKGAFGVAEEALKICLVSLEVDESTGVPTCSMTSRDEFEMQMKTISPLSKERLNISLLPKGRLKNYQVIAL